VWLSGGLIGLKLGGLARAVAPPLAAAVMMATGVALVLKVLPEDLQPLLALGCAVPLGMVLYTCALQLIAPKRLAEALRFVRSPAVSVPAPAE
jgi:hypothetical protein